MGRKTWNVVLVPEGGGPVRNLRIPARALYGGLAVLAVGTVLLFVSLGLHVWTLQGLRKVAAVRQENASLRSHLASVNSALEQVDAMVREGQKMEEQARLLAGLEPAVEPQPTPGVGGPLVSAIPDFSGMDATNLGTIDPELATAVLRQDARLDSIAQKVSSRRNSFNQTLAGLRSLGDRLAHTPSVSPLGAGHAVSSGFGWRTDPFNAERAFHSGLDLRAEMGTPIQATAEGTVCFVGWEGDYGLCIRIDHGYGLQTRYFHLSSTNVQVGQSVRCREIIGAVGSSGRSTAPHLHYEVSVNGVLKDPSPYINPPRAFAD